jgi:hypothetical protein
MPTNLGQLGEDVLVCAGYHDCLVGQDHTAGVKRGLDRNLKISFR